VLGTIQRRWMPGTVTQMTTESARVVLPRKAKRTENCHATPRVYLREFAVENMLAVFDKKEKEYRRQSVETTGISKHLYTLKLPEGRESDVIDEGLGRLVEGPIKAVLIKIRTRAALATNDIVEIFKFVALQKLRTPAQKLAQEKQVMSTLQTENGEVPNLFIQSMIRLAPKFAEQFIKLNVCLHVAPLGYSYITGDDPVVVIEENNELCIDEPRPVFSPIDILSRPRTRCFMPLNPKVCFFAEGLGHYRGYTNDNCLNVNRINRMVAFQSQRFLYADNRNALVQVANYLDLEK
jgi:Protein of unknown function (DUF4238)